MQHPDGYAAHESAGKAHARENRWRDGCLLRQGDDGYRKRGNRADGHDAAPEDRLMAGRVTAQEEAVRRKARGVDGGGNRHGGIQLAAQLVAFSLQGADEREQERAARKRAAEVGEGERLAVPRGLALDDVAVAAEIPQHQAEHDAQNAQDAQRSGCLAAPSHQKVGHHDGEVGAQKHELDGNAREREQVGHGAYGVQRGCEVKHREAAAQRQEHGGACRAGVARLV